MSGLIHVVISNNMSGKDKKSIDCVFPSVSSAEIFESRWQHWGGMKNTLIFDIYGEATPEQYRDFLFLLNDKNNYCIMSVMNRLYPNAEFKP